jgi:hypothetical protein
VRAKVAVLRVHPERILEDIDRLQELAGVSRALTPGARTILKDNISWHFPFPGANTTPWQLEGTDRSLRARGHGEPASAGSAWPAPRRACSPSARTNASRRDTSLRGGTLKLRGRLLAGPLCAPRDCVPPPNQGSSALGGGPSAHRICASGSPRPVRGRTGDQASAGPGCSPGAGRPRPSKPRARSHHRCLQSASEPFAKSAQLQLPESVATEWTTTR